MTEQDDESAFKHFEESVEQLVDQAEKEISADTALLANAIGGWRGALDSGLPSIAFLAVYFGDNHNLRAGLIVAVAVGLVLAVIALLQRKSLQQVIAGLFGVALSAYITAKTGHAQNFFLPGIIRNAIYGTICVVSIVLKRPLLGYALNGLRKVSDIQQSQQSQRVLWRNDETLRRKYSTVTWLWALLFLIRVAVMYPLWLLHATGALGVSSIVLGYPLFALVAYGTYLVLKDVRPAASQQLLL